MTGRGRDRGRSDEARGGAGGGKNGKRGCLGKGYCYLLRARISV